MEFYRAERRAKSTKIASFNSQRDGILQKAIMKLPARGVSIPNGMEFYLPICNRLDAIVELFQFPTGWNSTKIGDFISVLVNCFNSQRDGILLCAPCAVEDGDDCFNSQRDGILLILLL